jgi:Uma2 family endonuclease
MQLADLDLNKLYTYADYLEWQINDRVELLKGRIFEMSAPNFAHQAIVGEIFGELRDFFAQKGMPGFYCTL